MNAILLKIVEFVGALVALVVMAFAITSGIIFAVNFWV